jgi:NCS1 family nucleobase:cation symporter-1
MIKVPDLYTPGGIYWFTGGWNWRCIIALVLGMMPSLPGFFMICIDSTSQNAAVSIFQVCWFVGAPLSFVIYFGLNYFSPPTGLGIRELISEDDIATTEVVSGTDPVSDGSMDEKTPAETIKKDSVQI